MIKVYLYIDVETLHIGVSSFSNYKIVLSRLVFKLQILDDLWITDKNKKNSKYPLTEDLRARLSGEKYAFEIGLEVTTN